MSAVLSASAVPALARGLGRASDTRRSRAADAAAASDEDLLLATAAGDREAFSALYDRVAPIVRAVTRRVLRDAALADEVCQEVMVEVWRKSPRFMADRGSARGWISTLAHRRAIDRVRSEQSARDRLHLVSTREVTRPFDVVAEEVETRLDHGQVRAAVALLSDRQREAVELAYYGGHSYRDVAVVLGIPEGTAKSRLRDALHRLRTALEDLEGHPL